MLSGLFDLYLPLNNPSKAYRRLGGILCSLVLFIRIKYVAPTILIDLLMAVSLSYAVGQLFRCPYPYARLKSLRLARESWIVEDNRGHCMAYAVMRIAVDTGFYMVLHLSGNQQRSRLLVVFYDQFPIHALRQLNRLTKIKQRSP